jgi:uncharacterized protein
VSDTTPSFADQPLDAVGVRVLGALLEKEKTTPDNYPLTLNALTAACNQASNREPVMSLPESDVMASLDALSKRSLARAVHRSDSRVRRYRQTITDTLTLHDAEAAVMCVLMLRGAQTVGEIRTRTTRLFEFRDLPHVEITLQSLMTLSQPLVAQLPRQPGQKDVRYAHLLSGEPEAPAAAPAVSVQPQPDSAADADRGRIDALEAEVATLRSELASLRDRFDAFRREFQ